VDGRSVLVGGKGTRLRPLTLSAPKPMHAPRGVPFLDPPAVADRRDRDRARRTGTSYKAETFEEEFGDGSKLGLQLDYVVEKDPLGTGGGIANVAPKLRNDTVMVFNGDVLSGADLGAMPDQARGSRDADVAPFLVRVSDPRPSVRSPPTPTEMCWHSWRKPRVSPTDQINAGTYIYPSVPSSTGYPAAERSRWSARSSALLSGGAKVCGYVDMSYWRDMGTPEDFVRGSADLVRGIAPSPALGGKRGRVWCTTEPRWPPARCCTGGTVVGRGAEIGAGVRLDGAVVFDGAGSNPERWSSGRSSGSGPASGRGR
jgi:mannose-1-phosphate guanylyltransferase